MSVSYEWDCLEMSGDEVAEHNFCTTLAEALALLLRNPKVYAIELIRTEGNDAEGVTDRQWARYEAGKLPEFFSDGAKVPQRFHTETEQARRKIA